MTDSDGSALTVCEDAVKLSDGGVFRFDLGAIPQSQYGERIAVSESTKVRQVSNWQQFLSC